MGSVPGGSQVPFHNEGCGRMSCLTHPAGRDVSVQICNGYPPLCFGLNDQYVGREASFGAKPEIGGQCTDNSDTGSWFSLPIAGQCTRYVPGPRPTHICTLINGFRMGPERLGSRAPVQGA